MGIPENLYACSICEKSFPIAKYLVDHVNKHLVSVKSTIEQDKNCGPKDDTKVGITKAESFYDDN